MSDVSDFPATDNADDLEIKKRARRRLVGATVLALLAAVALPLVISNKEAPHAVPDMQVFIPGGDELPPIISESDAEFASVLVEPDAGSNVAGSNVTGSNVAESNVTDSLVEIPPSLPQASLPPPGRPAPERPAATPAPAVQPPSGEKPPQERASPSRSDTAAARQAEAARALALLNNTAPPAHGTSETRRTPVEGQVFVQVGAFSDPDRAARQAKELKEQGFAAYAEKAGKVTRVRIGPLSRSQAEQVKARLEAQGRSAVLSSR